MLVPYARRDFCARAQTYAEYLVALCEFVYADLTGIEIFFRDGIRMKSMRGYTNMLDEWASVNMVQEWRYIPTINDCIVAVDY